MNIRWPLRFVQFGREVAGNTFGLDMLRAADKTKSLKQCCPALCIYVLYKLYFSRLENSIIFWLVKKENSQTKDNIHFWSLDLFPFFI